MQKPFITPIKFCLAGVIAITVLFAVSTEVIAKGKVSKSSILIAPDGKRACLRILPENGCYQVVECKGFDSLKPESAKERTDPKTLKEALKLSGKYEPSIKTPGDICQLVIFDDGSPDSYQVCIYIPGLGTQCFTFK